MHRRNIVFGLAGLTALFSFAFVASANSTNLSFDPSYAQGPFSFRCQPYINSFEVGKHYSPDNGNCVFSIPNTISGSKVVALYKGTPGNSVFVRVEAVISSPTLVQADAVNFGTPSEGQDYFAAVYGADQIDTFGDYFRTGSTTNQEAPSNNFQILPWRWGATPASEYTPIVIIPDIFGSFKKDSGPVLDPIFNTYSNLIDTFIANGYVEGQTLFVLPYDWEASNTVGSAALAAKIQNIKTLCGCLRVDIIGHGTGGLIAEHYIESAGYGNDVDQLILLGTPISGTPTAYLAWEGGQVNFGHPLSDGLAQVLLNAEAKEAGYSSTFGYIQGKPVTSFKEMLPVYSYLFNPNELFYPTGYPRNEFIEDLLTHFGTKIMSKVHLMTVLGDNGQYQTISGYEVSPSSQPPLWPEGQPTNIFFDAPGDGYMPRASLENYYGTPEKEYVVGHRALPDAAQQDIFEFLNRKVASPIFVAPHNVSCVLFISTSGTTDLMVVGPNGERVGKDFSNSAILDEISDSFYSGFNAAPEYVAIANPINGSYQVQTQGTSNGSFTINTSDVCSSGVVSTSTSATTGPGQFIGYSLEVSTSTQTLEIQSLDNNPPVITITSPQNNTTYLTNQVVPIIALINDPENSPLSGTTYRVNGLPVNPGNPLATSTLGTSTLVVTATDIFGHTGYATSTFAMKVPPPPPSINASADTYLRGVASDTNEGASPLLRIQGAGDNRIIVKFNQGAIATAVGTRTLTNATLELSIQGTRPNWGTDGREVVVNRLLMNWTEGNGKNAELPLSQRFRGTGAGATWDCATDTNIKNTKKDCVPAEDWNMRLLQVLQNLSLPWLDPSTDGVFVQKNQQGVIAFDVTADVQAFLNGTNNYGWIVRKSLQNRPGYITFDSREAGVNGPKLILTLSD